MTVQVVIEPPDEPPEIPAEPRVPRPPRRPLPRRALLVVGAAVVALALVVGVGVAGWRHVGHDVAVAVGPRTWTAALPFSCPASGVVVTTRPDAGAGRLDVQPAYAVEVRNTSGHALSLTAPEQPDSAQAAFEPELVEGGPSSALDGRPVQTTDRIVIPAGRSAVLRVTPAPFTASGSGWSATAVRTVRLDATRLGIRTALTLPLPEEVVASTEGFPFSATGAERQAVCARLGAD